MTPIAKVCTEETGVDKASKTFQNCRQIRSREKASIIANESAERRLRITHQDGGTGVLQNFNTLIRNKEIDHVT